MNYNFSTQQHQQHDKFDPYELLDLPRDADVAHIRQRFRKLTKLYHPDRNRGNPNYNPEFYSRVCSAYEILSDPRQRAAYDQQHAPSWNVLRSASIAFTPQAPNGLETKGKFGSSDLKRFNEQFEQKRRTNANDRGYGDKMAGRTTIQDVKRGRTIDAPQNIFGSNKVTGQAFNSRFEDSLRGQRQKVKRGSMMERNGEPMGYSIGGGGGSTGGGAAFSEVSVYEGIIVDKERDDFSKMDCDITGLNYSDYMAGFETITSKLPEDHHYYQAEGKDAERIYNERLSELTDVPDRGHNMSFNQSELALHSQKAAQLRREEQSNRHMVLKYRDQYVSDDLLPPSGGGVMRQSQAGVGLNVEVMERPRPATVFGNTNSAQQPGSGRTTVPIPNQPVASFRAQPSTRSQQNGGGAAPNINDRMMNRRFDRY